MNYKLHTMLAVLLLTSAAAAQAEELQYKTNYPATYGSQHNLRATESIITNYGSGNWTAISGTGGVFTITKNTALPYYIAADESANLSIVNSAASTWNAQTVSITPDNATLTGDNIMVAAPTVSLSGNSVILKAPSVQATGHMTVSNAIQVSEGPKFIQCDAGGVLTDGGSCSKTTTYTTGKCSIKENNTTSSCSLYPHVFGSDANGQPIIRTSDAPKISLRFSDLLANMAASSSISYGRTETKSYKCGWWDRCYYTRYHNFKVYPFFRQSGSSAMKTAAFSITWSYIDTYWKKAKGCNSLQLNNKKGGSGSIVIGSRCSKTELADNPTLGSGIGSIVSYKERNVDDGFTVTAALMSGATQVKGNNTTCFASQGSANISRFWNTATKTDSDNNIYYPANESNTVSTGGSRSSSTYYRAAPKLVTTGQHTNSNMYYDCAENCNRTSTASCTKIESVTGTTLGSGLYAQ